MICATVFQPGTIDVYCITSPNGDKVQDLCIYYESSGNGCYLPSFYRYKGAMKSFKKIGRITNVKFKTSGN